MIKIKLSDNQDIKCFSGLLYTKDELPNYSIQLTDSNDYDYEFLVTDEFVNSSLINLNFLIFPVALVNLNFLSFHQIFHLA